MSGFFFSRREQFARTARRGRAVSGACWKLSYLPSDLPFARIGVSVPKRVVRLAVRRNRLRRMIRENFRQSWAHSLPPVDILLSARVAPANDKAARGECERLLLAISAP